VWCSCSSDEESHSPVSGQFVLDTVYARAVIPGDGQCTPPCAQTDLLLRYKFENHPGTIDSYWFLPLGGQFGWVISRDYLWPVELDVWRSDSLGSLVHEAFEGLDTLQVHVKLEGGFWEIYDGPIFGGRVNYYGSFTFDDTLIVPIQRQ
jgi:hypothetical protein